MAAAKSGISFHVKRETGGYRLLELPPSLLTYITSDPKPTLQLKSGNEDTEADDGSGHAVLCTRDATFSVRQVQSSNSVFLVQPGGPDLSNHSTSVKAVSECPTMLELVTTSPDAVTMLENALPIFSLDGSVVEMDRDASLRHQDRIALRNNMALSDGEMDRAWRAICAFNLNGQPRRPDVMSLLTPWQSIISAVNLGNLSPGSISSSLIKTTAEEDGYPLPLAEAIMDAIGRREGLEESTQFIIDKDTCICWITALKARDEDSTISAPSTEDLINQIKELLPKAWRAEIDINMVMQSRTRSPADIILHGGMTGDGRKQAGNPTLARKNSRKWHEKFKNRGP